MRDGRQGVTALQQYIEAYQQRATVQMGGGVVTHMVAAVGNDAFGLSTVENFKANGINTGAIP